TVHYLNEAATLGTTRRAARDRRGVIEARIRPARRLEIPERQPICSQKVIGCAGAERGEMIGAVTRIPKGLAGGQVLVLGDESHIQRDLMRARLELVGGIHADIRQEIMARLLRTPRKHLRIEPERPQRDIML